MYINQIRKRTTYFINDFSTSHCYVGINVFEIKCRTFVNAPRNKRGWPLICFAARTIKILWKFRHPFRWAWIISKCLYYFSGVLNSSLAESILPILILYVGYLERKEGCRYFNILDVSLHLRVVFVAPRLISESVN